MATQSLADKSSRKNGRRHHRGHDTSCMPEPWEELTTWIDQLLSPEQRQLKKEVGAAIFLPCSGSSMPREGQVDHFKAPVNNTKRTNIPSISIPQSQESLIAALSPCIRDSDSEESDYDEHTSSRLMQTPSEEDDIDQLRRLGSWDTNGTFGTIGTNLSSSTLSMNGIDTNFSPVFDDDGNEIDPKLLQKTIASSKKRHTKCKRLVKFDYPPVSSMRECPRVEEDDMSKVFFAEGELEQFEEDRISTNVADDIEIVAVASSSSASEQDTPRPRESDTPQDGITNNYVSTPRRRRATGEETTASEHAKRAKGKFSIHRHHHADNGDSPRHNTKSPELKRKEKRLIKSVQIYLRERSTFHAK